MNDTTQKAADLVQEAARNGRIALYLESSTDGDFRLIMPEGEYASYAELLYRTADVCSDHAMNRYPVIRLRD